MDSDIKKEVLNYLEGQAPTFGAQGNEKLTCRYLDQGFIDSMGIILMVQYLESRFGIRFSSDDLQSDEFQTPAGIISLIEKLKKTRHA